MAIVSALLNEENCNRVIRSSSVAFRTDADIAMKKGTGRERELQQWQAGADIPAAGGLGHDDDTFGPGANATPWDQFAANEKLFGVKTQFDENVYTTKLDRSAADFKERERQAQRIANEIIGVRCYTIFPLPVFSSLSPSLGWDE